MADAGILAVFDGDIQASQLLDDVTGVSWGDDGVGCAGDDVGGEVSEVLREGSCGVSFLDEGAQLVVASGEFAVPAPAFCPGLVVGVADDG